MNNKQTIGNFKSLINNYIKKKFGQQTLDIIIPKLFSMVCKSEV
ncbi:hypothetical protein I600_1468 [Maribacter dokdonensis DSW-8]|nr:hypothetical protein I600_1468 [Maribacter dokdonensis DSW-8]